MTALSDGARALLQAPNYATISTLRADGTILNAVVWQDLDGDNIVVASAATRAWPKNIRREGHASITVMNPENPFEYVSITGRVVEASDRDAGEILNGLAQKYTGQDFGELDPDEPRVTFWLAPDRVAHFGG